MDKTVLTEPMVHKDQQVLMGKTVLMDADGAQGPAGPDGQDGADGQDGLNALVSMTPESQLELC